MRHASLLARVLAQVLASLLVLLLAATAGAQPPLQGGDAPLARPAPPGAGFDPRPGAALPLATPFTGADGATRPLAAWTADRPSLLVFGYHRCPQLCGLLMQGVLEAVHDARLAPAGYRLLFVSIDPADTPADARARRRVDLDYARFLDPAAPPPPLERLTGRPDAIANLARAVGLRTAPLADGFAHPAGLVVATADGHVAAYLPGVRFDPAELRTALATARAGGVEPVDDRLALLCAHLDERVGRHTAAILAALRAAGLAAVAALALFAWRRESRLRRRP